MDDRFDRTRQEAQAAIERARERQSTAHDRRCELDQRIAELELPSPPHRLRTERARAEQARDRAAQAQASFERARRRAEEAQVRVRPG